MRDVTFEVGDGVFLMAQIYKFKSSASRPNEKLSSRFYGPFEVVKKIGNGAYRLALPTHSNIHLIFHVSRLKRAIGAGEVGQH